MTTPSHPRAAALAALAALAAALLGACADAPTTPAAHAAPRAALLPATTPAQPATVVGTVGDTTVHQFTYQPAAALTARIAAHEVRFPAGAVCDPRTSSYGAGTWDAPCTPLATGLTFTVRTWTDADGHPRIRFSPDVRFVPSATVTLVLYDKAAALDKRFQTVWCPTNAASCVNEAVADPSVATQRDPGTFYLYGRIKHFSGYNVVVDRSGDGTDGATLYGY
jgi:hypothetical protein